MVDALIVICRFFLTKTQLVGRQRFGAPAGVNMVDLPDKMIYRPCSRAQSAFLRARPPGDEKVFETLYSGAVGAGKTRALCMKVVMRAMRPGAREGLCRKTVASLNKTTLVTLLDNDGDMPPVLPRGSYEYNQQKGRIKIRGGGEIQLFAFDQDLSKNELPMGSYNFTGCGIDEGVELTKEQYLWLMSTRLRLKVKGLWPEAYTATNPGAKSHFLYNHFSIGDPAARSPYRLVLQTKSHENTYLTSTYLSSLDDTDEQFHKKYVEGIWGNFEGMIYSNWDREKHLLDTELRGDVYAGVDDGTGKGHAFCIVVVVVTGANDMQVIDEVYREGLLHNEKIELCRAFADKYHVDTFWVDPSAAGLILDLRNVDMGAIGARHLGKGGRDRNIGIGKIQHRLAVNSKLGRPRLLVHPRCVNLIREIEGYHWEPGRDVPHKENDHAVDALRYMVMSIDRAGLMDFEPEAPPLKDMPRWTKRSLIQEGRELVMARDMPVVWDDDWDDE